MMDLLNCRLLSFAVELDSLSRIDYFENNRQNLSSHHLELVILENRLLVTICKNNKLQKTRRK